MRLEATMIKLSKNNEDLKGQIRVKDARYLLTASFNIVSRW